MELLTCTEALNGLPLLLLLVSLTVSLDDMRTLHSDRIKEKYRLGYTFRHGYRFFLLLKKTLRLHLHLENDLWHKIDERFHALMKYI